MNNYQELNKNLKDLKLYQIWFSPNFTAPNPRYFKDKYDEKDFNRPHCLIEHVATV